MEKLFSFSLYGNHKLYTDGAIKNAELIPEIFGKDWKIRFYVRDVKQNIIEQLKKLGCEIKDYNNNNLKNGRLYRFLAVRKDNIVIVRDADSIVTYREKMMVDEFLNSKKKLHIIRDHPNHKEHILAGMVAFNCAGIEMGELINNCHFKSNDNYNTDQIFLAQQVYPLFKKEMLIHDNFNNYYREREEIVLKYPRVINHIGQRIMDEKPEDSVRLEQFNGYIKFEKKSFGSMYELIYNFCNYLSISRSLKRKYVFDGFYINDEIVLLDDYLLIKELFRYTFIVRGCDVKEEFVISKDNLGCEKIKLTTLMKQDKLKDIELINLDIEIENDTDYDSYTLFNVIQLTDEINYKISEYVEKKKLDRYNTIINHSTNEIDMPNVIKYNELYNDFSEEKNLNELIKLFSGIFRIHVKPNMLVTNLSRRYWHHWDGDFAILT
jgi:hypothetical protein